MSPALCRVVILVWLPLLMSCAENGYNKERIQDIWQRVSGLEEDMTELEASSDKQESLISQMESATFEREKKLDDQEDYNTAFIYGFDERDEISGRGDSIVFREEVLKVGEGYDPSSGVFTCPKKGMYMFTLIAASQNTFHIDINVNGNTMATIYVEDQGSQWDQSSGTIVVFLNEGDEVTPTPRYDSVGATLAHRSRYSTFSGVLLKMT